MRIFKSMQLKDAPEWSLEQDRLKKQHDAYFPILNDPELLSEYILDFFGPSGHEPLLEKHDIGEAEVIFQWCCSNWKICCGRNGQKAVFVTSEADTSFIPKDELEFKVLCMAGILEDSENLLSYLEKVFGPDGPEGLAITDEETWDQLDDLFRGRLPSPLKFQRPKLPVLNGQITGGYRKTYAKGQFVEVVCPPLEQQSQQSSLMHAQEDLPPVFEPEVIQASTSGEQTPPRGMSAMEIAAWCAVGVGAAALGGLALKGIGRFVASPTGKAAIGELLTASLASLSSPSREVFVGPRGGRYTITANGTKSYNVP